MKPIVGVMPLWDDKKNSIWMLPGYMDGLSQAGLLPIILPFSRDENELEQLMGICDGVLFTGGHDVSPELYQETPLEDLVSCCPKRDTMEVIALRLAIDADKPVLGICRGLQFINAALGGTLYQDLPSQHPSDIKHRQEAPYDVPSHTVSVIPGSPLYDCLHIRELPVNSCHHQAIKDLASGLEAMAVSPDGLTEALYKPDHHFLWAVQWHPEFSYRTDPCSRMIFRTFAEAMK